MLLYYWAHVGIGQDDWPECGPLAGSGLLAGLYEQCVLFESHNSFFSVSQLESRWIFKLPWAYPFSFSLTIYNKYIFFFI